MPKQPVTQEHHISYNPPRTVFIYKGEHWILTQLHRRKRVSKGFLRALRKWIRENRQYARKL